MIIRWWADYAENDYPGIMLCWALCGWAEKFRSARCQQLARGHLHITPIQTTMIPLALALHWQKVAKLTKLRFNPANVVSALHSHFSEKQGNTNFDSEFNAISTILENM